MFSGGLSNPMIPLYASTLTTSLLLIGMVTSSFWAIRIVSEMPIGVISDHIGRRKPIVTGILFGFLGTVLFAATDNIFLIIVGQAIRGAGMATFFCVSMAMLTEIVPPQSRGRAMGIFQSIEFIGSTLGAALGGMVASILGYRGLFWVCTSVAFCAFTLSLFLSSSDRKAEGKSIEAFKQTLKRMPSLVNLTMIVICFIILLMMVKDSGFMMTTMPLYVKFYLGMSLTDVSLVMASRGTGVALGSVSGGWLSDRMGRERVLAIGLALSALSIFFVPTATSFILLAFLMFMEGMGMGYVQCTVPVLVTDMFPSMRGPSIGLYRTFFDMGGFVGPFIVTIIVSLYGYTNIFYIITGLMLLNLIASSLLRRKTTYLDKKL